MTGAIAANSSASSNGLCSNGTDSSAALDTSFGSIDALYEQGKEITWLETHYIDFDRMTSGLQESELIIIAARPSMGKTAWAINIAENAAVKSGKVVAVFPVEDEAEIMIITQQGKLIRLEASDIRKTGRSAQGVRLIKTDANDMVTSASLVDPSSEEELEESPAD